MTSSRPSARWTSMTPQPPIPHIMGSITPWTKAVATAASTALPPDRRTERPTSAAWGCGQTIIPDGRAAILGPSLRVDDLAAHVARVVAAQEGDHVGDVDRLAQPVDRGTLQRLVLELLPVHPHPARGRLRHAGLDEARRDGVHVDVELPELDRQGPRHALEAGLGGRVVGRAAVAARGGRR